MSSETEKLIRRLKDRPLNSAVIVIGPSGDPGQIDVRAVARLFPKVVFVGCQLPQADNDSDWIRIESNTYDLSTRKQVTDHIDAADFLLITGCENYAEASCAYWTFGSLATSTVAVAGIFRANVLQDGVTELWNQIRKRSGQQTGEIKSKAIPERDRYGVGLVECLPPEPDYPEVTFTITTCRRLDLFVRTMDSFLETCQDQDLIKEFICCDDGSSEEDRETMMERFPFFRFIFRGPEDRGHAASLNELFGYVQTRYILHTEDDWLFTRQGHWIRRSFDVLNDSAERGTRLVSLRPSFHHDMERLAATVRRTRSGAVYYDHIFDEDAPRGQHNGWWPGYTLNPSLQDLEAVKATGAFDPEERNFERKFGRRFFDSGFRRCNLSPAVVRHIGKDSAYKLNATAR